MAGLKRGGRISATGGGIVPLGVEKESGVVGVKVNTGSLSLNFLVIGFTVNGLLIGGIILKKKKIKIKIPEYNLNLLNQK